MPMMYAFMGKQMTTHRVNFIRGIQRVFSVNIFLEKQILPRIFFCLNTATNVMMTVAFNKLYNFRSLSDKFATIFGNLIFHISLPKKCCFRRKRKPKIFGFKNVIEMGVRKILRFVKP